MIQPIEGVVDCVVNGFFAGWARVPGSSERLEIRVHLNGVEVARTFARKPRADLVAGDIGDGQHGFLVSVDRHRFKGAGPFSVTVFALRGEDTVALHPGPMQIEANDGFGYLEGVAGDYAFGWVAPRVPGAPKISVELLIDDAPRGQAVPTIIRHDLEHFRLDTRPTGFVIPLPLDIFDGAAHRLAVRVVGSDTVLFGGPRVFEAPPQAPLSILPSAPPVPVTHEALSHALDGVARQLLLDSQRAAAGGRHASSTAHTWVRAVLIPELLRASRARPGENFEAALRLPMHLEAEPATVDDGVTDIVIPVYRGRAETLACIKSVIESVGQSPQEIVVVDDCTPDPALAEDLAQLEAAGLITRLVNPVNLGFVASANAGMALHAQRDVVLLNSDTLVPRGWLDRLRRAAYVEPDIGTVTPFSNRATICSFPAMPDDSDLPAGWTAQALDDAFARHNAGLVVDIPTAVGFCMYIKRAVIRDTGFFDEITWGRGYGEENDYCMRSTACGWRHVQACDIFVEHHGSVSFSAEKTALIDAHLAILHRLYPDYSRRVAQHLRADPAAPARRRVLKEVFQKEAASRLLFITHVLGGGTQVAVDALTNGLAKEGMDVLLLVPLAEDRWRLARPGDSYGLDYCMPDDFHEFLADLRLLGVWHVHCHHLAGFGLRLLMLLDEMKLSYDVSVHDYLWICPRVTLLDADSRYCGEPAADACDRCIATAGVYPALAPLFAQLGHRTENWRRTMARVLQRARRVIVPSEDVAARLRRHMKLDNVLVRPHPEAPVSIELPARACGPVVNVAVLGAIGEHKGLAMLRACIAESEARGMNVSFKVIGHTADDASLSRYRNVLITGRYARHRIEQIVRVHQCHIALFLSPGPETFSYTLSEALCAGLYPVVPDLGAPAARVRETGFGEVYSRDSTASEILERLLAVAAQGLPAARFGLGRDYGSLLANYYGLLRTLDRSAGPMATAVCVLGMHRSGTSALAGALGSAGLRTGDVLHFGSDNVKGHIESQLVIGVNEAVLHRSGGAWRQIPQSLAWTDAERRRRDAFVTALEAEGSAWLFKDPRTLLTLPFWREALPGLALVGTFRHPLTVAFSLFLRNGMALDEALRLWTAYNRRLLAIWQEEAFPLLCFDLPEGAYRGVLNELVAQVGSRLGTSLDAQAAGEFFAASLRVAAIPKAVLEDANGPVATDFAAALQVYEQLLGCAGVDRRLLMHTDHCLPLDPSIEGCRRLLADAPDNAMVLAVLATLLERAGDHVAACAARRDLVQLMPGNYLVLCALLDVLAAAGLHKEALAWATRALATHPDNPDLHLRLARASRFNGDYAASAAYFRLARDADYQYLTCDLELAALATAA